MKQNNFIYQEELYIVIILLDKLINLNIIEYNKEILELEMLLILINIYQDVVIMYV